MTPSALDLRRPVFFVLALALGAGLAITAEVGSESPRTAVGGFGCLDPGLDVKKFVGAERCAECHQAEHTTWKASQHATGFSMMHRDPKAKKIAAALGIRRIKTAASCVRCHYTPEENRGRIRARSGVSCESCHGGARDWIEIHDTVSDVEGNDATHTAALRQKLIDRTKAHGMRRPDDVYSLVANCFSCHLIEDSKLVAAGHPTGIGFELLAWTQGEVRHNYLDSAGAQNAETTPDRKRLLYVMGQVLELRSALDALSRNPANGPLHQSLKARANAARQQLGKIVDATTEHEELGGIAQASSTVDLTSAASLGEAVRTIDRLARRLAVRESGKGLAGIDKLLPTAYRGASKR